MTGKIVVIPLAVLAICSCGLSSPGSGKPPQGSTPANPDYYNTCAPLGEDESRLCLELELGALDHAGESMGYPPLRLPDDLASLPVPEQFLIVVNEERTDRSLAPFAGFDPLLESSAAAALSGARLPEDVPGSRYHGEESDSFGYGLNGLDIAYQMLYNDGPGSGVADCTSRIRSGCWVDRSILLAPFPGNETPVIGAADDPASLPQPGLLSQPYFDFEIAGKSGAPGTLADSWTSLQKTLAPSFPALAVQPATESDTGSYDPSANIAPIPDYTTICSSRGLDATTTCQAATLAAINHAHALEHIAPMALPTNYRSLSIVEQTFVVVNLERIDRGLPAFTAIAPALDALSAKGAATENDPPSPDAPYVMSDTEWAGGIASALDADYGWMYYDGYDSGNLDCRTRKASGCWGHRNGILDDFGTEDGTMLFGGAYDPTGNSSPPATSLAMCLAVSDADAQSVTPVFTWEQEIPFLPTH